MKTATAPLTTLDHPISVLRLILATITQETEHNVPDRLRDPGEFKVYHTERKCFLPMDRTFSQLPIKAGDHLVIIRSEQPERLAESDAVNAFAQGALDSVIDRQPVGRTNV